MNTGSTSRRWGKKQVISSDDEEEPGDSMPGEGSERSPTPRPQEQRQVSSRVLRLPLSCNSFLQPHYATQDDIQRICQSFHDLTRNIVEELVSELRRMNSREQESRPYAADEESEHDTP